MYEDPKVNIRFKLSALWIVLILLYIYPDILMYMQPGNIKDILAGQLDGTPITPVILLAGTMAMALSSCMVFLCLVLKPRVNRWLNMSLGAVNIGLVAGFVPGKWAYYVFNSCLEILVCSLIVRMAWKWPRLDGHQPADDHRPAPAPPG